MKDGQTVTAEQLSAELQALFARSGLPVQELLEQLRIRAGTEDPLDRLQRMRPVTQEAVLLRYGLLTGEPMTEAEVAAALNLTERRVQQIICSFRRRKRGPLPRMTRFIRNTAEEP